MNSPYEEELDIIQQDDQQPFLPPRKDMSLDDQQEGLLQTAFVVSYMLLAPVFGYLGDRMNRKLLILIGMVVWVGAVVVASFLREYYLFLTMRMLVGVGEAAYSTVAPAILADLFTDTARTRALVAFYIAMPVGSGIGFIVAASVADWTGHWAWSLRVSPALGCILLVVFALFFKEPVRGAADRSQLMPTSYREDIRELAKIPTYTLLVSASIAVYFVTGALSWWTPNVTIYAWQVIQRDEASPEWFSSIVGVIFMFGGIFGVPLGSAVSKCWANGFSFRCFHVGPNPRADPLYCAIGLLISVPFLWIALYLMLCFSLLLTWLCTFVVILLLASNYSITTDVILSVTPPTRRSSATAIQILVAHLFGDAGSPYIVGLISDRLKDHYSSHTTRSHFFEFFALRDALFLVALMLPIGAFFYFMAALTVEKDRDQQKQMMSSSCQEPRNEE
uniref:Major facilitator superfamily (MFS) profile domain-containing protein n=1 Tax=Globodera rostochiensis TaxID=31243 RepID=A0A914H216_GLORO